MAKQDITYYGFFVYNRLILKCMCLEVIHFYVPSYYNKLLLRL